MNRPSVALAVVLLCVARSATASIVLEDAEIGVGGLVRAGGWTRFVVTLASRGAAFEGEARVNLGGMTVARELAIPAGGIVRWEDVALTSPLGVGGALTVSERNRESQEFPLDFTPNLTDQDAGAFALTTRRGALSGIDGRPVRDLLPAETTRIGRFVTGESGMATHLPTIWLGWDSIDIFAWSRPDPTVDRLTGAQKRALTRWLLKGGTLIVRVDETTRGLEDWFLSSYLPEGVGWRDAGLGRVVVARESFDSDEWREALSSVRWSPLRAWDGTRPGYIERLDARLRTADVADPLASMRLRRFGFGAAVWLVVVAACAASLVKRRRLSILALLVLTAIGVAALPIALRSRSRVVAPTATGVLRLFPETREALWRGVVYAPPVEERHPRVPIQGRTRLTPIRPTDAGELRVGPSVEARDYAPNTARPAFWQSEAFTPFIGEIAAGVPTDRKIDLQNETTLMFERGAVAYGDRVARFGAFAPGDRIAPEWVRLSRRRALWSELDVPSRAIAMWARESYLDALIDPDQPVFIGWTRGETPIGGEAGILLLIAPLATKETDRS